MPFLFQGCLKLSFKNWTGLSCGLTMDRIAGLQDLLTMHRFEGIDIVTVQEFAVHTV